MSKDIAESLGKFGNIIYLSIYHIAANLLYLRRRSYEAGDIHPLAGPDGSVLSKSATKILIGTYVSILNSGYQRIAQELHDGRLVILDTLEQSRIPYNSLLVAIVVSPLSRSLL